MTIFYVCRHGETENNKRKRLMGWIDTPLTAEGKLNAQSSAKKLKNIDIDQIISSDLGRTFATAYIISRQIGYTSEIEMTSGLREMNYGDLANQPYSAYPVLTSEENLNFIPPNGESLGQMQKRVLDCVESLSMKYEGKSILLVAHDGTINALRARFNQTSMGQEDATHNSHDYVARFVWDSDQIRTFEEITPILPSAP